MRMSEQQNSPRVNVPHLLEIVDGFKTVARLSRQNIAGMTFGPSMTEDKARAEVFETCAADVEDCFETVDTLPRTPDRHEMDQWLTDDGWLDGLVGQMNALADDKDRELVVIAALRAGVHHIERLRGEVEQLEQSRCSCGDLALQVKRHGKALESSCLVHEWDLVNELFPPTEGLADKPQKALQQKFVDELRPIMDPVLKMLVDLAAEPAGFDIEHVSGVLSKVLGEAFAIGWREGQE